MTTVFVTGATGVVGSAVAHHLLERGADVIAGVRHANDRLSLPPGVETRAFDFAFGPAELDEALAGADRLFLMRPPPIADVARYLFPVIDAASRRAMRQIVFLSLQGVQFNRATPHHAVEAYLRQVGTPFTFLRPNFFMQNLSTTYAADIRDRNVIDVPAGRSRTAFIDARDIGRVGATVLTTPGHDGKAYTLNGEQSLTYRQVASIMTELIGRPISYTRPSADAYLARLAAEGHPQDYIDVQRMIWRIVRLNVSALPNRQVRTLTGRPATTFQQFVLDHRSVWAPT